MVIHPPKMDNKGLKRKVLGTQDAPLNHYLSFSHQSQSLAFLNLSRF